MDYRAHQRREHIRLGLPDALDLMVVCVDAGLGIDQALLRAGQELVQSQPEISEEFIQVNFEQRAGKPRLEAWQSMAERTQVETVQELRAHAGADRPLRHAPGARTCVSSPTGCATNAGSRPKSWPLRPP